MTTNPLLAYSGKMLTACIGVLCGFLFLVSVPALAQAPLSGSYTINQDAPASATNFVSFMAAADALNTQGVAGPVTINVAVGTSPYISQQFVLGEIPGSSAANTVTINGNGEMLSFCGTSTDRDIIRLDGTDNININGLSLFASCTHAWGIHLMGDISNVMLSNNTIFLAAAYSTVIGTMNGIVFSNSTTNPQTPGGQLSGLTITGNTIVNGYHGIRIEANAAGPHGTGLVVGNNHLVSPVAIGIDVRHLWAPVVNGNHVTMRVGAGYLSGNAMGIVLVNVENGLTMSRNKVVNAGTMGVYLYNINQNSTTRGTVANNMIGGGFQNNTLVHALQLNFASYLDLSFNSTLADNGTNGSGCYISNQYSQELRARNNSFAYTGTGAGFAMQANSGHTNFTVLNYNNYYSPGQNFVRYAGASLPGLAALQQAPGPAQHDAQSMAANPLYVSATDLHIQAGSPLIDQGIAIPGILIDFDGQIRNLPDIGADEYVGFPRLAVTANPEADIYPNPFAHQLNVKLPAAGAGQVQLVLTDLTGRQVYSERFAVAAGSNTLQLQPAQHLPQGIYLLQVQHDNAVSTYRVVKQ